MQEETFQTPFSKAILTSVFVGFSATIVCLLYNIIYRDETGFPLSDYINVSTLIFAVNTFFVIIGFIYFLFAKSSRKPEFIFIALFLLLTVFGIFKAGSITRSPDHDLALQFSTLFRGIVIIIGIGVLCIPFLFHNKSFRQHFL